MSRWPGAVDLPVGHEVFELLSRAGMASATLTIINVASSIHAIAEDGVRHLIGP